MTKVACTHKVNWLPTRQEKTTSYYWVWKMNIISDVHCSKMKAMLLEKIASCLRWLVYRCNTMKNTFDKGVTCGSCPLHWVLCGNYSEIDLRLLLGNTRPMNCSTGVRDFCKWTKSKVSSSTLISKYFYVIWKNAHSATPFPLLIKFLLHASTCTFAIGFMWLCCWHNDCTITSTHVAIKWITQLPWEAVNH